MVNPLIRRAKFSRVRYACLLTMSLIGRVLRNYVDKRMKEDGCRTKASKGAKRRERGRGRADPASSLLYTPAAEFPEKAILRITLQTIRSFPFAHQLRLFFPSLNCQQLYIMAMIDYYTTYDTNLPPCLG